MTYKALFTDELRQFVSNLLKNMKCLIVSILCISLQVRPSPTYHFIQFQNLNSLIPQQCCWAAENASPSVTSSNAATETEQLLIPRHAIKCGTLSQNIKEYMTNYEPLLSTCLSVAYRMPSAVQRIKEHNTNVYRTMSDTRRFQKYMSSLISNRRITADQRQQLMTSAQNTIQTASNNYKTTSEKYLTEIDKLVGQLDSTFTMQKCVQTLQQAIISEMNAANTLMMLPNTICNQLNSKYAKYEKSIDAAYTAIGARIPS